MQLMIEKLQLYFQYPVCEVRPGGGSSDRVMFLPVGGHAGVETVFLYRRRAFPCGIWRDGGGICPEFYE